MKHESVSEHGSQSEEPLIVVEGESMEIPHVSVDASQSLSPLDFEKLKSFFDHQFEQSGQESVTKYHLDLSIHKEHSIYESKDGSQSNSQIFQRQLDNKGNMGMSSSNRKKYLNNFLLDDDSTHDIIHSARY